MKIPKFLKRKRNIWIIAILIVIIFVTYLIISGRGGKNTIQTDIVERQNIQETVLATGQVVSTTDLGLSFQAGGAVRKVNVKEGDRVFAGQILASLDQSSALASLTVAQGALAQAQANYDKLVAGATPETVQTKEDAVSTAEQNLENEYGGAINTLNSSHASAYNAYNVVFDLRNDYFSSADQPGIVVESARNDINENVQKIESYVRGITTAALEAETENAISLTIAALNKIYNDVKAVREQCDVGIYYSRVSATDKTSLETQKTAVNTALTNVLTLQQNIASLKIALQTAKNQLSLTKAPPTQAEINEANAKILSAQGQVDSAQATLRNLVIVAPVGGTITQVDIKVGEQAIAMQEVMVLQNIGDLYAEANVSEANIARLEPGQNIDYTFDALGVNNHFFGKVLTINPSSTVVSGVVNYKVKGSLDNISGVKPGMTVNMAAMVAQKDGVLAIPSTAVINKNNKQYVRVVDDAKNKKFHEIEVQTGLIADGGLIEIVSGLGEGQEIVIYLKP